MKKLIVCFVLVALSMPAYAVTVIGDWEQSSDGWSDWIEYGNGKLVSDPLNMPSKYSYSTIGATSGHYSLHVAQSGWCQNLSLDFGPAGHIADFMANTKFSVDVTVPADQFGTGGWCEIYALSINAQGYGWHDQMPVPTYHWDYWAGVGQRTATITWDYSAAKAQMPANPYYLQFVFATCSDGKHNDFYFDNARLFGATTVPEPATIAMLTLGGLVTLLRRKDK